LLRCVRLTFGHDFDDDLAAELGDDGRQVLEFLKSGALDTVTMKLGALKLHGAFRSPNGSEITVPHLLGIKATAKAAKNPDVEDPRIAMVFECVFEPVAWGFFGEFSAGTVHTEFTDSQSAFDFTDPAAGVKAAVGRFRRAMPKDTTVTFVGPDGQRTQVTP
jgi:hypothetical protein